MPVPLLKDARPAGWVTCFGICAEYNAESHNRAAKGSILKEDEIHCQFVYIIYLWLGPTQLPLKSTKKKLEKIAQILKTIF